MTDRKRHVGSEGIFQHCSLVTAPRGNVKADGWYFIFLGVWGMEGRGGSCVLPMCSGVRPLPQKKQIYCFSLASGKNKQNHFVSGAEMSKCVVHCP